MKNRVRVEQGDRNWELALTSFKMLFHPVSALFLPTSGAVISWVGDIILCSPVWVPNPVVSVEIFVLGGAWIYARWTEFAWYGSRVGSLMSPNSLYSSRAHR